jgi:hypothetical protein
VPGYVYDPNVLSAKEEQREVFCSFYAFGLLSVAARQQVTIDRIELTQTMTQGVDDLTIWVELHNAARSPITVRDMSFSRENQRRDS